ncbi:MAG: hypothetical protein NZ740_05040 [Kiritimatiellae bacterium]|nr:hypothetical protein [Kiritimatiellia bacterium]MDW8458458.1 hypothetical protein [Verrucomicrobiota bacterium]
MLSRRAAIILFLAAVACWFGLASANLLFGELNQDEGWYLYAARSVYEGRWPYRDFAFTQGPMLPLVYGAAAPFWLPFGVGGGRAFTALLGLASIVVAAVWAGRLAPRGRRAFAAFLAFAAIAVNVYHSYFTTVVKTYSLAALLLVLAFALLTPSGQPVVAPFRLFLSGFLLAAAAATRITLGLALAATGLVAIIHRREFGRLGWVWFAAGGTVGLLLLLGVFYRMSPEVFRFFMFEYHAMRDSGGALKALAFKVGFLSRLSQGYFVPIAAGVGLAAVSWLGFRSGAPRQSAVERAAWLTVALVTVAHVAAPFPYDDYQVPIFPLFAALVAAGWARTPFFQTPFSALASCGFALAVNVMASVSSPINQSWLIVGRDRIWWRMREQPSLLQLREVARRVRNAAGEEGEVLTQDTYLAVEAGLRVPAGWEMGVFSYYPDWSLERAEAFHVVNRERVLEQVDRSPARVAALSDYAFSIAAPAIAPLPEDERRALIQRIERRFPLAETVPHFGQGNTTLRLFVRPQ